MRVYIADDEVIVVCILQTEQFGRERGDIAVAGDVQHAKGYDLFILHDRFLGTQDTRQHRVDLANEAEPLALPGPPPEPIQKIPEAAPQIRDALSKLRIEREAGALLARLRSAAVHDKNADLLDQDDIAVPLPAPSR